MCISVYRLEVIVITSVNDLSIWPEGRGRGELQRKAFTWLDATSSYPSLKKIKTESSKSFT